MASTKLTRTSGTPTLNTKYTLSFWVKRSKITYSECFLFDGRIDASNRFKLAFDSNDKLGCFNSHSGSDTISFGTNKVFRDTSGWYHIVLAVDTTQATSSDRVKLYVNGVQETSFSSTTYPSQNDANNVFNENASGLTIGAYYNSSNFFEGLMTQVIFVDGTAYAPSTFGSINATSGIWVGNTSPTVTYGNNGFNLDMANSSDMGNDVSGNANDFTVGGTLTQAKDCPDNVFATLNSLATSSYGTLSKGNNTVSGNASANSAETFSTLSTNNDGKYYYEIKCTGVNGADNPNFGFIQTARGFRLQNGEPGLGGATNGSLDIRVQPNGKTFENGAASGSAVISTYTAGDILGFAIDSDNGAFYVAKNGTWQTSGNPESGASRTGAIKTWSPTDSKVTDGQSVCIGVYNTATIADANFGNGYFGTTAVASAGTNASSNGIFEYDVPTGYTALTTKGFNL